MGSCFSRKENRTIQLESCISPNELQLDSSFSLEETQLDSCISQYQTEEYIGIGWFDLPYEMRQMIIDLMNLEAKARFAQCSIDCYEEVAKSRNYIEEVKVSGRREEGEDRSFAFYVKAKKEEWIFMIYKSSPEYCRFSWYMKDARILSIIFRNQDLIEIALRLFNNIVKKNTKSLKSIRIFMDNFPFDRTNINNLKSEQLGDLTLWEIENGINPISCGFVNLDTISRFQHEVNVPNVKLDVLFKIRSKVRYLINPIFSLDEFDDFLRRLLIEEEIDEKLEDITLDLKGIKIHSNDLIQVIEKYTGPGEEDEIEEEEDRKSVLFVRDSKKFGNREHTIILDKSGLLYFLD